MMLDIKYIQAIITIELMRHQAFMFWMGMSTAIL